MCACGFGSAHSFSFVADSNRPCVCKWASAVSRSCSFASFLFWLCCPRNCSLKKRGAIMKGWGGKVKKGAAFYRRSFVASSHRKHERKKGHGFRPGSRRMSVCQNNFSPAASRELQTSRPLGAAAIFPSQPCAGNRQRPLPSFRVTSRPKVKKGFEWKW